VFAVGPPLDVSKNIYSQSQPLWELWETRSAFGGEFSKRCGNGGKIVV
jgi:hypothetical protein